MEVTQSEFGLLSKYLQNLDLQLRFRYRISILHLLHMELYFKRNNPKIEEMHMQLIKLIDQVRMLDQDLIRLQEKVNVVLEYRERQKIN